MISKKTADFTDFACDHGRCGRDRCKETLEWAYAYLYATAEDFLTKAIFELSDAWGAEIVRLPSDQWGAVVAESPEDKYRQGGPFSTYIQCDKFEDGLAFTVKAFYDHYGDARPWKPDEDDSDT